MTDHGAPPDERDQLIAEYVLGVLSADERAQVEAMAAQDPKAQAAIAAWQSHFACWLDELPEASPPEHVWQAIEEQLFPVSGQQVRERPAWWRGLGFWRWTSAALAAGLLVSMITLLQPPSPTPPAMLARLEQSDGNTLFAATVQAGGTSVLFIPTRTTTWQYRSAQVWLIGGDGTAHSLGLLPANVATALVVPSELASALTAGAVLAVSLEPPEGSPTGLPTGPVIAQGKISSL
ncbi:MULTISPECIES: anti-sigma factor [unclassified Pseudomonas]|uniref:anti-sigma factor n=1 Tax=unclassified Pseudomonas TaxID=196821 RepID=UPI001AE545CA|nr:MULTISPECIES: anti-sigma factor [unclassified Pseudomonas]MBP2271341.1 anti-sigma-K factor RskA [Pseudomonas sp. BP6]MBP2289688.1 anti-sigma-K factor RskA [Pseudomonas sp. BP7]HDS1696533.1 anti-sigma factor [Pseudomonas putida]HDS1701524.1 anti-sigma factor [Pseudomonas putida]